MEEHAQEIVHLDRFYRSRKELREYYQSLPGSVQLQLCRAPGPITTLGELQSVGERLRSAIQEQGKE